MRRYRDGGGPLAGGLLIHLLGWRSIFLVNVPIALIGAWLTTRVDSVRPASSDRPMDVAGQLLAIVALGASVAVLIEGAKLGWQAGAIRVGAAIALAAWAAFVLVEAKRKQPMLPLGFFRSPSVFCLGIRFADLRPDFLWLVFFC